MSTQEISTKGIRRLGRRWAMIGLVLLGLGLSVAPPSQAAIGIDSFEVEMVDSGGDPVTQAGATPYEMRTSIAFETMTGSPIPLPTPTENVRGLDVDLPLGMIGDPTATAARCTEAQIVAQTSSEACPLESVVGYVVIYSDIGATLYSALYNMVPRNGAAATLAFNSLRGLGQVIVHMDARLQEDGEYDLVVGARQVSRALNVVATDVIIWGTPADPGHDPIRGLTCLGFSGEPTGEDCSVFPQSPRKSFLRLPTDCASSPMTFSMRADSWQTPGEFAFASTSQHAGGEPMVLEGCEDLPFDPSISVTPTSTEADSPTGLEVEIEVPQSDNPDGLASAHLKDAEIALPTGLAVNPAAASGQTGCSMAQVDLNSVGPASCPDSSKIGTVEIETPLLEETVLGSVYLAEQGDNPFNSLLAMYVVAESKERGITVKLAGKITPDPATGRLVSTFEENPQLPFEALRVRLKGGSRAPLLTPPTCGTYTTEATLTPWSGNAPSELGSSFRVTSGPNGGSCPSPGQFSPSFEAGTVTPIAGAHSPLIVDVSRSDGSAPLSGVAVKLPEGLLGTLAGVSTCSDASLSAAAGKSGAAEQASPSCPASSRVGTVDVGAGAGSTPLHVEGAAYLAGPYKGAPLSMAIVTPAVAGPFDLGTVVVRAAMSIDPRTAEISVQSDPIPQILQGIPLAVRSASVRADRPQFTFNPTSCDPMAITGTIFAPSASVDVSNRFQVGACAALGFKPDLRLNLIGGTKRGAHPKLRAVLTARPGDANIGRASVALPKAVFLDQGSIGTVCTRVQFAADACPAASVYGQATAYTPILDEPLTGPVYLRSSSNDLPDLVAALKGPAERPVEVELAGRIDSVKGGGIRNTFAAVPDAPVTKFVLEMRGGKKKGLVELSRDVCAHPYRADVKLDSQSGKTHDTRPLMRNGKCGKKGRKGKRAKR